MTHNYAILKVSPEAYREIRAKLEAAGYSEQFHARYGPGICEVIDMHGIALQCDYQAPPVAEIDREAFFRP